MASAQSGATHAMSDWNGRAVMEARAYVLSRDGAQCRECGWEGSTDNPLVLDHIQPRSKFPELTWDRDNWQVLCRKHNLEKSNKLPTERKRVTWYDSAWF